MAFPGYSYGAPGGFSGSAPGGFPGNVPGSAPGGFPGNAPGGFPGSAPGNAPGGFPGGFPGSFPQVSPQVQNWFSTADRDRSGRITALELQSFLDNGRGGTFSIETVRALIEKFGVENKTSVNVYESQALFDYIMAWLGVFNKFDHSQSEFINGRDLPAAFEQMGYRLSADFFDLVITRGWGDEGGCIHVDNFIMLSLHIEKLTDEFRNRHPNSNGLITLGYEDFLTVILKSDF